MTITSGKQPAKQEVLIISLDEWRKWLKQYRRGRIQSAKLLVGYKRKIVPHRIHIIEFQHKDNQAHITYSIMPF